MPETDPACGGAGSPAEWYLGHGRPEQPALASVVGAVTYGRLRAAVRCLAQVLEAQGVARGARVAVFAPTSPEFAVVLFASFHCGAAVTPLDVTLKGDSLRRLLAALRPTLVVTTERLVRRFAAEVDGPWPVLTVRFDGAGGSSQLRVARLRQPDAFETALAPGEDADLAGGGASGSPADDALLLPTSGTTSRAKLVRLSQRAIRANVDMHLESIHAAGPTSFLQVLPVHYSYGLVASFLSALRRGGRVVLPRFVDRAHIVEAVARLRPQVCVATPGLSRLLLEGASASELAVLRRLAALTIGGDRCPPPLRAAIAAGLPGVPAYVTYGQTEVGPRVSTLPAGDFLRKPESVGLPLSRVTLRVVGAAGQPCAPREAGRLLVRTPSLMSGYLAEGTATGCLDEDDWYETGDLAALDDEGFIHLHGRRDRQCKVRGRRINPALIEVCLEGHPEVVHVDVTPERDGAVEWMSAVVRHRSSASGDLAAELLVRCKANLPAALVPDRLVLVSDDGAYFKGRRLVW